MRIVGGQYRGRALIAPEGRLTRPTTDRMRESIASMILSAATLDLSGMHVLDAFAGSGAVGLELISRGAAQVTFCERDAKAMAALRKNCQALSLAASSYKIVRGDVLRLASERRLAGAPFDIVFLDPPYKMDAEVVSKLIDDLVRSSGLSQGCIIVYEREAKARGLMSGEISLVRSRTKGTTCVDLYRFGEEQEQTWQG